MSFVPPAGKVDQKVSRLNITEVTPWVLVALEPFDRLVDHMLAVSWSVQDQDQCVLVGVVSEVDVCPNMFERIDLGQQLHTPSVNADQKDPRVEAVPIFGTDNVNI